jgi:hypothetical protein
MIKEMTEMKRFYAHSLLALLVGAAAPALAAADVTESEIDAGGNRARAAIRRQL